MYNSGIDVFPLKVCKSAENLVYGVTKDCNTINSLMIYNKYNKFSRYQKLTVYHIQN